MQGKTCRSPLGQPQIEVLRALGSYEPGLVGLNAIMGHHFAASVNVLWPKVEGLGVWDGLEIGVWSFRIGYQ